TSKVNAAGRVRPEGVWRNRESAPTTATPAIVLPRLGCEAGSCCPGSVCARRLHIEGLGERLAVVGDHPGGGLLAGRRRQEADHHPLVASQHLGYHVLVGA